MAGHHFAVGPPVRTRAEVFVEVPTLEDVQTLPSPACSRPVPAGRGPRGRPARDGMDRHQVVFSGYWRRDRPGYP